MNEEIQFQLEIAKEQMQESIIRLENILSKIRAGKANPQMLHSVSIDYYGVSDKKKRYFRSYKTWHKPTS